MEAIFAWWKRSYLNSFAGVDYLSIATKDEIVSVHKVLLGRKVSFYLPALKLEQMVS